MRKAALAPTLITPILVLAVAVHSVSLARANFWYNQDVLPPQGTKPPAILILSPKNNSVYAVDSFCLTFNASTTKSWEYRYSGDTGPWEWLMEVYYTLDWTEGNISVFSQEQMHTIQSNFYYNKSLTQIPDGKHEINVSAIAHGSFTNGKAVPELTEYFYNISGFSTISFTVDTISPNLSVLSLENKTYFTPDVPLDFVSSEPVSKVSYVLDGCVNVTISGNTTMTGLSIGEHNLTVYAFDVAGNMGASETVTFVVAGPKHFPIMPISASIAAVAIVSAVLLVYFKKSHRDKSP